MSKNIFCLIKTCALISNSLFYSDGLLTFSLAVNSQCHSNIVSIKQNSQLLRSYPRKIYWYFNRNESFMCPKIYFAWLKLTLWSRRLLIQRWSFDLFADSQRSMPVKHSFNETNIALMPVEKLTIF